MELQVSRRGHNLDSDSSTSETACVSEVSSEDDNISLSLSNDSRVSYRGGETGISPPNVQFPPPPPKNLRKFIIVEKSAQ